MGSIWNILNFSLMLLSFHSSLPPQIISTTQQILSNYYVAGTIPGAGGKVVNKTDTVPVFMELTF